MRKFSVFNFWTHFFFQIRKDGIPFAGKSHYLVAIQVDLDLAAPKHSQGWARHRTEVASLIYARYFSDADLEFSGD